MGVSGLIAFDVNETLLSLEPVRIRFDEDFGDAVSVGEWFAHLLHGSLLANALDVYRTFGEIGAEALIRLARRAGVDVSRDEAASATAAMAVAPPYPDVLPAVERLAKAGVRMVALTNGSTEMAEAQVANAGLDPFLERVISCDEVGRFKPDPAVYRHAAQVMGIPIEEMTLVAAHDWDCAGAMSAGAGAVFVRRPSIVWDFPVDAPEIVVSDIGALADVLLTDSR